MGVLLYKVFWEDDALTPKLLLLPLHHILPCTLPRDMKSLWLMLETIPNTDTGPGPPVPACPDDRRSQKSSKVWTMYSFYTKQSSNMPTSAMPASHNKCSECREISRCELSERIVNEPEDRIYFRAAQGCSNTGGGGIVC